MSASFQSEFPTITDGETIRRFREELWKIYSTRVKDLIASGSSHRDAINKAFSETKNVFMSRHPELRENQVAIRLVGIW